MSVSGNYKPNSIEDKLTNVLNKFLTAGWFKMPFLTINQRFKREASFFNDLQKPYKN
jgi:hypothetical protein